MVDELDLSELRETYAGCGSEAYPPESILKGVLVEMLEGRLSPTQWFRNFRENSAVRWATMGLEPSRSTLYVFRDRAAKIVYQLHQQLVRQAQAEGYVQGRQTVQDGTIIRACASRHRLHHFETVQRRLTELEEAVRQDLAGTPAEPACRWMARTVGGRAEQVLRYRKAEEILRERLAQNARRRSDKRLPVKQVMISASDPEAALGRDKEHVFGPCYTTQCVTDMQSLVIVAFDVFARATDAGTLAPLLDRTRDVLGTFPAQHVVDAGYVSILDTKDCATRNVELIGLFQENDLTARKRQQKPPKKIGKDAFTWLPEKQTYLCPEGRELRLKQRIQIERSEGRTLMESQFRCPPIHCQACRLASNCCRNPKAGRTIKRLDGEELLDEHRRRMETPEAQELRRRRGQIIERVFADFKAHRNLRRLHGRGISRAKAEIGMLVIAYNLQRLNFLRERDRNSNPDNT